MTVRVTGVTVTVTVTVVTGSTAYRDYHMMSASVLLLLLLGKAM